MNIIDSGKTFNNMAVGYSIEDNGYSIYLGGNLWITQPESYGKLHVPSGTYEENAIAHIDEICNQSEQSDKVNTEERLNQLETSQAEQDDMIAELMFGGEQ